MKNNEISQTAKIITFKTLREQRFYLALAQTDEHWQQTTPSFALEGLRTTKEDPKRVSRVVADVWSLEQAIEDVRHGYLAGMVQ